MPEQTAAERTLINKGIETSGTSVATSQESLRSPTMWPAHLHWIGSGKPRRRSSLVTGTEGIDEQAVGSRDARPRRCNGREIVQCGEDTDDIIRVRAARNLSGG
jgi:hypothetical protein